VAEAESPAGEQYGELRLVEMMKAPQNSAVQLVRLLFESVDAFAGTAPQHDDITCLVLKRT
jgi:serine phosphatase RsbU (regulator of sigma subunit)